jgi:hypothetical protein
LALGFKYFLAYCTKFKIKTALKNENIVLASAMLIEDEEDEVKKT